jgi:hypothetical protein
MQGLPYFEFTTAQANEFLVEEAKP